MKYNFADIAERIRDLRKNNGMSQEQLIGELKDNYNFSISRNTLSKIENGEKNFFTFDFLYTFAEMFDCDIGFLLGEYEEKKQETHQICSITGLSEKAVENLVENKNSTDIQYISFLLEYGFMRGFFNEFSLYVNSDKITLPKNNNELSEMLFDSDDTKLGEYIENENNFTNNINLRCSYPLQLRSSFDTGIFEKAVVLEMQDRLRMIKEDIENTIKDGEK